MTRSLADLIEARFGESTTLGRERPAEGELARILGHRSFRKWRDAPVDDDLLELLFACALSAPSKSDLQQTAIIHITDRSKVEAIAALVPAMPWIAEAPVFLLFCGDGRRIRRICEMRGKAFAHEPLDAFFNAAVDAAIAMATMIRAAEAEGLGCCPISAVRENVDEIARLVALPEAVFPVAGLCIGWPEGDPWISLRLPVRVVVHRNAYDDSALPVEIDAYDRRRAERNPIRPDKQRNVERFGTASFYGWSEDKARQVAVRERARFTRFVKENGFPFD